MSEVTYPFRNFNGAAVEVWEMISNFIPHFTGHVIMDLIIQHLLQNLYPRLPFEWRLVGDKTFRGIIIKCSNLCSGWPQICTSIFCRVVPQSRRRLIGKFTVNRQLSWCWHRRVSNLQPVIDAEWRLSLWQPTVPPVVKRLISPKLSAFIVLVNSDFLY